jgi:hypothetical protein
LQLIQGYCFRHCFQKNLLEHPLRMNQRLLPHQPLLQPQQRHRQQRQLLRLLKLGRQHLPASQVDQTELAGQSHHRLHQ